MTGEPETSDAVELPRPTVAPLVLSVGLALLAAGAILGLAFLAVGGVVFVVGLGLWVADLLPGRGHAVEPLAPADRRPRPITGRPGTVGRLAAGTPGYRLRMPTQVHPVSAGVKGGLIGGGGMPVPALLWGLLSGRGLWFPINLLAGMALPGVDTMTDAELGQFHPSLFVTALVIHAAMAATLGLVYGVLLPTLPDLPRPLAWGGLLMPLLWTAVSYTL